MTKILLVEDDKSLREIYGVRLLAEGYDIVSAGDGEEALAMAIKERPLLIVSDVMMPKISGFDMLDILRSTTETKDIKVIMMTALSSEDQRKRGEELGADKYLVKSQVGIEDVVRAVHEVLGDAPTSAAFPQSNTSPAPTPTPATAERPATPVAPTRPAAVPTTPVAPTPATPKPSELPQPTAPFSTPRPATGSSMSRTIEPLSRPETDNQDAIADRIARELGVNSTEARPAATPAPAPMPEPMPTPTQSTPTTPTVTDASAPAAFAAPQPPVSSPVSIPVTPPAEPTATPTNTTQQQTAPDPASPSQA